LNSSREHSQEQRNAGGGGPRTAADTNETVSPEPGFAAGERSQNLTAPATEATGARRIPEVARRETGGRKHTINLGDPEYGFSVQRLLREAGVDEYDAAKLAALGYPLSWIAAARTEVGSARRPRNVGGYIRATLRRYGERGGPAQREDA
jgi:hypothetical protein